ncbi:MAG: protein-glutamate O-methyltransferase [Rhodospirillales bacterium]|nr:protein-glutamate O-methyltransferase [Alphaproteobacteria bacterium]MCB1839348.1 protein-glutamate O-methyltransferase [Alphaproteobacteria bacterium]MCB9976285.1 protein-glutamate O-methyltransferase [Rhodospirillales bacterium]
MRITDFDIYRDLLKDKSGLVITPDKSYLLDSRLNPVAKKWGYESIDAMTNVLRAVPPKDLVNDIVEAMTTNETSFFRDNKPFDTFKAYVLKYFKGQTSRPKRLRIWSAASSSGQEAYSLSMLLKEEQPSFPGWQFEIVATDISHEILEQAKDGLYTQFEVQRGLPIQYLMKYFTQHDDKWQLNPDIRSMVKFQYFNLLDKMSGLGQFDVIFCRNVLIYFDQPTKKMVLENMAKQLAPDGLLFLGGAETVLGITEAFKGVPSQRALYAKPDSAHCSPSAPVKGTQALA